jgi:hypothetical protein
LVSLKSKKQPLVVRSTAEAEYIAITLGVVELLWLRNTLIELGLDQGAIMKLWRDNKSANNIANNPVQHDRTKHIEIIDFSSKKN